MGGGRGTHQCGKRQGQQPRVQRLTKKEKQKTTAVKLPISSRIAGAAHLRHQQCVGTPAHRMRRSRMPATYKGRENDTRCSHTCRMSVLPFPWPVTVSICAALLCKLHNALAPQASPTLSHHSCVPPFSACSTFCYESGGWGRTTHSQSRQPVPGYTCSERLKEIAKNEWLESDARLRTEVSLHRESHAGRRNLQDARR